MNRLLQTCPVLLVAVIATTLFYSEIIIASTPKGFVSVYQNNAYATATTEGDDDEAAGQSEQEEEEVFQFSYAGTAVPTATTTSIACIDYNQSENTIIITCDASFRDVVDAIEDEEILSDLGDGDDGEYLLNASLEVADDVTFEITSNDEDDDDDNGDEDDDDNLQYLKIGGDNGIIVHGRIEISDVIITSWDTEADSPVMQNSNGSVRRAFINLHVSEGGFIQNSEIAYLGYNVPTRRGIDLGTAAQDPSHDFAIINSSIHDNWMGFYSSGAYNILIDGNEFYDNISYAIDPHSGTHNMTVSNNKVYNNQGVGIICSDLCYDIIFEGNKIENNTVAGIYFSRNMSDSIARNNYIYNSTIGIIVSESSNNQIYNNTIEETDSGIRFVHLEPVRDGETENNLVYNNTISNSENGINVTRSHNNNIAENHIFSNITESEYVLSGNASITIREQHFDDALIRQEGNATNHLVEIVDSGTIEIIETNRFLEDSIEERNYYNTDEEPYRRILDEGDGLIVNSQ